MNPRPFWLAMIALLAPRAPRAHAEGAAAPLTVEDAIRIAGAHHPAVDEDAAAERAAAAQVDVERARYWPDVEVFAQLDRTSANVVPGALFGVPSLPVVAGSPGRTLDRGTWTTAAGATASWDVLGYRRWDALIDQARAEAEAVHLDAAARALDLEYTAADRFIVAVSRREAVEAARASVDRAQVFVTIVKAAVDQNLRPGADLSRAQAELALAQTALSRASTGAEVSVAQLAEALGTPAHDVALVPGSLLTLPPRPASPARPSPRDPHVAAAASHTAAARRREAAIDEQELPKLDLVGALWMRGNGALAGGAGADGLVPDVPNWALGVVVSWPLFVGKTVEPQARVEAANVARDLAREREVALRVQGQVDSAQALLEGAYQVAADTPVALQSAREAETQATARYQAGLATADDVAQAQRILLQAETDDAVARLDVWRAILLWAYAGGDLAPFTALVHAGG